MSVQFIVKTFHEVASQQGLLWFIITTNQSIQLFTELQADQMEKSQFWSQVNQIELKDLQVLIQSQAISFKPVPIHQISSRQAIMIYICQTQNKYRQTQQQQIINQLQSVCIRLLNDEFQPTKTQIQSSKIQTTQTLDANISQGLAQFDQQTYQNEQIFKETSKFLAHQILLKIQTNFPKAIMLVDLEKINKFSFQHCEKLLQLTQIQLSDKNKFQSPQQLGFLVGKVILPILVLYPEFNFKSIQLIKSSMNYFEADQALTKSNNKNLSQIVTQFYLQKFNTFQKDLTTHIQPIIVTVTAIQAVHGNLDLYNEKLVRSEIFLSHIYRMLLSSNVQSKTANSIAINIYGSLLKQRRLYCNQAQVFIALYSTLRCFGAHLVKDIWPIFYDFIQFKNSDIIFSKAQLIDLIFYKIEHHENSNVVKHCIQSILQQKRSFILFKNVPDAIYNSLMRILNHGMHYLDCLFHMDSKMFLMISNFFGNFFNSYQNCKEEDFGDMLKLFLKSILEKISFDHALVAMLHSFTLIQRKSQTIDRQVLSWIQSLITRHYVRFPIRKRHQMMNSITYLLKNHLRISLKDIQSLEVNTNPLCISLSYLVQNCLLDFPEQYLSLVYNGQSKKSEVFLIITENYSIKDINACLREYGSEISRLFIKESQGVLDFDETVENVRVIQLILFLSVESFEKKQNQTLKKLLQSQTVQILTSIYGQMHKKYVIQLGESLYKSKCQRIEGVKIQLLCLQNLFALKYFTPRYKAQNFIQKCLTNISLLSKDYFECQSTQNQTEVTMMARLAKMIFKMIYKFSKIQDKQMEQKVSRIGSQFLEWATDNINHKQCFLLVISVLKTRIEERKHYQIEYIEESVYNVCWSTFSLQYKLSMEGQIQGKSLLIQKIGSISPIYRLRLFVLSSSILFDDRLEISKLLSNLVKDIDQIADRYDFQNFDQVFYLIELIYTIKAQDLNHEICSQIYQDEKPNYVKISKLIHAVIHNMLSCLNYGIDTKQVINCIKCLVNITFCFASKFHHFSEDLISLCLKVLQIGREYWMFQKTMTFTLIANLRSALQRHSDISYSNLFPLLSAIICIEQYRGYDSAIQLQKYLTKQDFYTQLKLNLNRQADYQGLTCRLGFIQLINQMVEYSMRNNQNHHKDSALQSFLQDFFKHLVRQISKQNKQKMFLTGLHKDKLKHWQCLMVYHPNWIFEKDFQKSPNIMPIQELIIYFIEMVNQSNLGEIKYYLELFLMKLMINKNSQKIFTPKILNLISEKLVELITQVNKNVSFIVISGMVINYLFKNYNINKQHSLFKSLERLYNALLSYACSHAAYFRGLSQYFCLQTVFIESEYIKILHSTIGQDPDTILLRDRLRIIIQQYLYEIHEWNVRKDLFKQIPNLNANITSETFYIEKLKNLAQQLLRQAKGEVGFYPYRQIWLEAVKTMKLTEGIQIDFQKEEMNLQIKEESIFQRKIDPSLDFIYFSKAKLEGFQMKVLITGAKSIPIYGHLSRTGQIFGLSQLILPYKQIIQDQEYKNVACTAQKWLNIRQFSNKRQMQNKQKLRLSLQKQLLNAKQQGYIFFLLKKQKKLDYTLLQNKLSIVHKCKKILLILDEEQYLPQATDQLISESISFGKMYSQHVEASIFTWEYFRKIHAEKFRKPQVC